MYNCKGCAPLKIILIPKLKKKKNLSEFQTNFNQRPATCDILNPSGLTEFSFTTEQMKYFCSILKQEREKKENRSQIFISYHTQK